MVSSESNHAPRFLTAEEAKGTFDVPTMRASSSTLCNCWRDPMSKISVLLSLSINLSEIIQSLMSAMQFVIAEIASSEPEVTSGWNNGFTSSVGVVEIALEGAGSGC